MQAHLHAAAFGHRHHLGDEPTVVLPDPFGTYGGIRFGGQQRSFSRVIARYESASPLGNVNPGAEPSGLHKVVAEGIDAQAAHILEHTAVVLRILLAARKSELDAGHIELVSLQSDELEPVTLKGLSGLLQNVVVPDRLLAGKLRGELCHGVLHTHLPHKAPPEVGLVAHKEERQFHTISLTLQIYSRSATIKSVITN